MGGWGGQEGHKFKDSLDYLTRPCTLPPLQRETGRPYSTNFKLPFHKPERSGLTHVAKIWKNLKLSQERDMVFFLLTHGIFINENEIKIVFCSSIIHNLGTCKYMRSKEVTITLTGMVSYSLIDSCNHF